MKNLSLILNIVLLIAVIVLYVKVFGGAKKSADNATPTTETAVEKPLKIAYINADTLFEKFDEFKKQRDAFQKKEIDADASLKAKGRALEQDFLAVQKRVQTGTMAPSDIQKEEQRLVQKQQALQQEQERVTKALLEENKKVTEALQKQVIDKLKDFKNRAGYDFILSYTTGGPILVTNDSLDITTQVLQELNTQKGNN
ncbi:MAG: OmpH family outer membrane protein [Saprospiraceae bacterium]